MPNKNVLIGIAVVVILLLGAGGYFYVSSQNKESEVVEDRPEAVEDYKDVTAEEIGLTLTPLQNGQVITLEATKLDGINSLEYEVSYEADSDEGLVPRGVLGTIDVKGSSVTQKIDLGTCSRNVCKYDKGVKEVKFTIKVNYANGGVGLVEETVSVVE